MEKEKPIALWKNIVGVVVSGLALIIVPTFTLLFYNNASQKVLWFILFIIGTMLCLLLLVVNIANLLKTIQLKKENTSPVIAAKVESKSSEKDDNTELLHKLLKEGKITIEEYDQLKK